MAALLLALVAGLILLPGSRADDPAKTAGKTITLHQRSRVETDKGSGRYHGSPFYIMEYVEGESLDHILHRRARLPWQEIIKIGITTGSIEARINQLYTTGVLPFVGRDGSHSGWAPGPGQKRCPISESA